MSTNFSRLASIATKIRNPLGLCGLVVVVLYALYRQVLSMDIFSRVGETSTVKLVGDILDRLFWLAMTALLLAVVSHIVALALNARAHRHAKIELVDAHLTPGSSREQGGSDD